MDNSNKDISKKQDNSGWWGLLAIIIALLFIVVNPKTSEPSKAISVEPSNQVYCSIPVNCGGGTQLMTRIQCSTLTCCQIGSTWSLRNNSMDCKTDQDSYNAKLIRQLFDTTPSYNYDYTSNISDNGSTGSTCCKVCTKGKPCGDSCISVNKTCHVGPGCAC